MISLFPTAEDTLCCYAALLASRVIGYGTIRMYLSSVRQLQISKRLLDPRVESMVKLSQVLKGIHSSLAGTSKVRLPITPHILARIKDNWEANGLNNDKRMIWAAMMLCFFGFFRSGELCVPSMGLFDTMRHLSIADALAITDGSGRNCKYASSDQKLTKRA